MARRLLLVSFVLTLLAACAHTVVPARRLAVPERSTAWMLSVTVLGSHLEDLDVAVARSFDANPEIVRVERPQAEGHVDLTVSTTGTPLVDADCMADTHVVVYRGGGGAAILDETAQQTERCGFHGDALDALRAQAVAWALDRALAALAQP